jgi:hypothetical protein
MRKRGSIVCKLRSCLPKGPTNSARMRNILTAALQRQFLQTELILWIRLVHIINHYATNVCEEWRYSSTILNLSIRGQLHAPAGLPPGIELPLPVPQEAG